MIAMARTLAMINVTFGRDLGNLVGTYFTHPTLSLIGDIELGVFERCDPIDIPYNMMRVACVRGYVDMANAVLSTCADPQSVAWDYLTMAEVHGHANIIELLRNIAEVSKN